MSNISKNDILVKRGESHFPILDKPQTNPYDKFRRKMNSTKSGIFGILGLILGVLVIFFVLNYFNILSLSALYPNKFNWLPKQTTINRNFNIQKVKTLTCPVDSNCNSGEVVYISKTIPPFYGIGYAKLPAGTKLLAMIPGSVAQGVSIGKNNSNNIITITNKSLGIEADYSFIGTSSAFLNNKSTVEQSDQIGILLGPVMETPSLQKNYMLIVSVQNLKINEFLKLKSNFEQKIEK